MKNEEEIMHCILMRKTIEREEIEVMNLFTEKSSRENSWFQFEIESCEWKWNNSTSLWLKHYFFFVF